MDSIVPEQYKINAPKRNILRVQQKFFPRNLIVRFFPEKRKIKSRKDVEIR